MLLDRAGRRGLRVLLAMAGLAGAFFAMTGVGRGEGASARPLLVGVWLRVDSEADDARRREAIERATADMSALIRPVARGMMRRSVRPAARYEILPSDPGLSIRADDDEPVTARLDGALDRDPEAEVRSHPIDDGFEQIWRTDDSTHGRTRWQLVEGTRRLVVTTHIEDSRFSAPLVYAARYERAARPGEGHN